MVVSRDHLSSGSGLLHMQPRDQSGNGPCETESSDSYITVPQPVGAYETGCRVTGNGAGVAPGVTPRAVAVGVENTRLTREDTIPPSVALHGDFNIQDRTWDEGAVNQIRPSSPFMRLQELFTDLEIQYVHPVNRGTPTRIPDDAESRASVIDLVAASAALINQEGFHYKVKVDDRERWGSDHRPLQIEVPISGIRRRLNYRHTAKMAQATDLPIELIDLIFSFLPPNHAEQVQWRRAAAAIGREPRPDGWRLEDLLERPWILQRWNNPDFRHWEPARFFTMCPCGEMMATYFGRDWVVGLCAVV
ncbi:hypothetical protein AGABI2DRAFT_141233 [Agaricus bisporus var. bisporus H97]|uniref:hypothetical protein n=1 Tax=Agaricus bisporus var. bisporus (strain H97 / ATCC MYA-4626 / FGSC 10389) TaxID=936046 RepID=UPI00029F5510|nr:hypothetical protein AGABI2DRAFT_141233 [Agaricus bisporus var. bisporus H97]EKV50330.1 hypothetical protein AGABI2DRAFT_141233 [Agaricus bisporus var. bisporus H97]